MRVGGRFALAVALLVGGTSVPARAALIPDGQRCFIVPGFEGDVGLFNLTPLNASALGHGYVAHAGAQASKASNVNFGPGTIDPNLATAGLARPYGVNDGRGSACFTNSEHATVDLVVDHLGTLDGAAFIDPAAANRVLDTREGSRRLRPSERVCFAVTGAPGDAALVNLTPVNATRAGHGVLISSDLGTTPTASNVNFAPGRVDPNVGIAPIGADGRVCYVNSQHGAVDLVADHLGSIRQASVVLPSGVPVRALDTRAGLGGGRVRPGARVCFAVAGPPGGVAVVNLTPVLAAAPGNGLLVSSDTDIVPIASNVNFAPGTIDPNVALAPIGADGRVCYVNSEHGEVDVIADHLGTISSDAFRGGSVRAPTRVLDTRPIGALTLTSPDVRVLALDCDETGALCVAGGHDGSGSVVVHRSNDAGVRWSQPVPVGAAGQSTGVDCPSTNTCFLAGGSTSEQGPGFVLRSVDGGVTFTQTLTLDDAAVVDISCPTSDVCVASTSSTPPGLLRSSDGGATWHAQSHSFTAISQVDCPTTSTCYINGALSGTPGIVRSTDAGVSWTTVTPPPVPANEHLYVSLRCFDDDRCVVVDVSTVYALGAYMFRSTRSTSDGGATWSSRNGPLGGPSDCGEPDWCVQRAGSRNVFVLDAASDAWPERDLAVPAYAGEIPRFNTIQCPLASACFVLGDAGTAGFISRVPRP